VRTVIAFPAEDFAHMCPILLLNVCCADYSPDYWGSAVILFVGTPARELNAALLTKEQEMRVDKSLDGRDVPLATVVAVDAFECKGQRIAHFCEGCEDRPLPFAHHGTRFDPTTENMAIIA
jgi:hypothetical protein